MNHGQNIGQKGKVPMKQNILCHPGREIFPKPPAFNTLALESLPVKSGPHAMSRTVGGGKQAF